MRELSDTGEVELIAFIIKRAFEGAPAAMPDGPAKQPFLIQIGSLRTYLDMNLWIETPGLKRGA